MSKRFTGENALGYKHGQAYKNNRIRKGVEWKYWRESVFKRDNYTCQDCGIRSSKGIKVELHPHHIKQYSLYPELRFELSNGITLCKPCHMKTDTYLKPPKKGYKILPKRLFEQHRKLYQETLDELISQNNVKGINYITKRLEIINSGRDKYSEMLEKQNRIEWPEYYSE